MRGAASPLAAARPRAARRSLRWWAGGRAVSAMAAGEKRTLVGRFATD